MCAYINALRTAIEKYTVIIRITYSTVSYTHLQDQVDFGEGKKNIYAFEDAEVLVQREKEVQMAVKDFGNGRSVYISGLPYSFENARVLYRAVLWLSLIHI